MPLVQANVDGEDVELRMHLLFLPLCLIGEQYKCDFLLIMASLKGLSFPPTFM